MEYRVSTSVRNLVEFVMRSGDITSGLASAERMNEGTRIHKKIQSEGGENYDSEVPVSIDIEKDEIVLEVAGRIDGIIHSDDGVILNEIKSVSCDINFVSEDYDEKHWAQLMCYGYIYSKLNGLKNIKIRLTYFSILSDKTKDFNRDCSMEELEKFFDSLAYEYIKWVSFIKNWQEERNLSIKNLKFPFASYRKGQRRLAVAVYRAIRDGKRLFASAPTGTGKTAGVLFSAVKAMGENITSKIFYLTAKTTTRRVAENTCRLLRDNGFKIKSITLTAKEKICFKDASCNPNDCEFANGHFDRVNDALRKIIKYDSIDREKIEETAMKYNVCPFELSLDAAIFADIVICDYNYVFDPSASLKRFFMDSKTDYTLLTDEAHNLVDRARDMYSASLNKKAFLNIQRETKVALPDVSHSAGDVNKYFICEKKKLKSESCKISVSSKAPEDIYKLLNVFTKTVEKGFLQKHGIDREMKSQILELYFNTMDFMKIYEAYDEKCYRTYFENASSNLFLCMMCINPSPKLDSIMKKVKSTVLFSATLRPFDYYEDILGGRDGTEEIALPSPFPPENLKVFIDSSISTKFADRDKSYDSVADDIIALVSEGGNYLVFFPSYKYLEEVYKKFEVLPKDTRIIIQKPDMSDDERNEFLNNFSKKSSGTLIGFTVMGGIFGEGIDLTGDRLSGAVIVGVGLPKVGSSRDIIKEYYDEKCGTGFKYAYIYPGMNKVLQAAGRVIRTESDKGVLLLIDTRFLRSPYRSLLPDFWHPLIKVRNAAEILYFIKK